MKIKLAGKIFRCWLVGHPKDACIDIGPLERKCTICGCTFGLWDYY